MEDCDSIEGAKKIFNKIYEDKTNNVFGAFVKRSGFYNQLLNADEEIKNGYRHAQSSTLDKRIENLLKLLIDEEIMKNLMVRLHLDPIKMPLATIGSQQIKKARFVLNEIEQKMTNRESASNLNALSTEFYHWIPHTLIDRDIDSKEILIEKRKLLEELGELHFTYELIHKDSGAPVKNTLDEIYTNLNVQIGPLDSDSDEFGAIKEYLGNNPFKHEMEIEDIFKIERNEEEVSWEGVSTNRWLLWHGSRITSFVKILKEGLKIPDVEGMFGKGIYFADVADKSAKYCYAHETDGIGLMVLCEVALGKELECYEYLKELPDGFNSIFAVGKRRFPEEYSGSELKILEKIKTTQIDGVNIPKGKPEMMNIEDGNEPIVDCNEFVVYNENQAKIRYLVKLKIEPKNRNVSQTTVSTNRYGI